MRVLKYMPPFRHVIRRNETRVVRGLRVSVVVCSRASRLDLAHGSRLKIYDAAALWDADLE